MYNEKIRPYFLKISEVLYLYSFIIIFISGGLTKKDSNLVSYLLLFVPFIFFILTKFVLDDSMHYNKKIIYLIIYQFQIISNTLFHKELSFLAVLLSVVGMMVFLVILAEKGSLVINIISIVIYIVIFYFKLNLFELSIFLCTLPFIILLSINIKKINYISSSIIDELSTTDDLTGLLNQSGFMKKIEEEFYRSQRYGKHFSILMIDSDNLKAVNDTYGHKYGSMVIVSIADTIRENIRRSDFAARYGGDEFLVCLVETDINGAMEVAERIRKQFELKSFFTKENKNFMLTLSIGVSGYPESGDTLFDVIDNADKALYKSKNSGKNKTSIMLKN